MFWFNVQSCFTVDYDFLLKYRLDVSVRSIVLVFNVLFKTRA